MFEEMDANMTHKSDKTQITVMHNTKALLFLCDSVSMLSLVMLIKRMFS